VEVTNDRLETIAENPNEAVQREEIESIVIELRKWRCLLPGEPGEEETEDLDV